ncbi:PASTA domain-containing protein, partial [uncultured Jatrophihabitans sp.]|uniref:Stk1 family PASTA domain-containing Ser/Thr kinase n=1 Tax=uncultured Jatrophihabitans sp. TaxID=1610747 RepID=UPI0035CC10AA
RAVESDASATRTGLMMGTVAYCSPEQIARGSADPRSDVYSAGVVLFELLTGQPPYRGDSAMNIAYQHVHSRVPAPSSRLRPDGDVPSEIDELVINATDSDPSSRPADAAAFLAELADVRAELALPVTPVPRRVRSGAPGRGPRRVPPVRHATPDAVTTGEIRSQAGRNDTVVDPEWARTRQPTQGRAPARNGKARGGVAARGDDVADRFAAAPPDLPPDHPGTDNRAPAPYRRRRRIALIVVLLLALLGAGVGYGAWYFAAGRFSQVPAVRGATEQSALQRLKAAGYRVSVQPGPRFDDTVPRGRVLRTTPAGDARVVRGARVVVLLSAGPQHFAVDDVAGQDPDQARQALLSVGPVRVADQVRPEASDTVPAGRVTRTDPAAGAQVTSHQTITIYVSTGPPMVDVPDIAAGTPVADAKSALKKAHFKVNLVGAYNDTIAANQVIAIAPTGQARKFSAVTVTYSRGPQMVPVPNIAPGDSVTDARQALAAVGLRADVRPFLGEPGTPTTVLGVNPRAGTQVRAGSVVIVYGVGG